MAEYAKVKNRWVKRILGYPGAAIVSHWLFQSLFYADTTERLFKILLDGLIALIIGTSLFLFSHLNIFTSFILGIFIAHTLNFLFNGQVFGALKHYGIIKLSYHEFRSHIEHFSERTRAEPSINKVLVCGNLSRGHWSPQSDFDIRIIRHSGVWNGIRASIFLMMERSRAFITKFPIDIYVLDSEKAIKKQQLSGDVIDIKDLSL